MGGRESREHDRAIHAFTDLTAADRLERPPEKERSEKADRSYLLNEIHRESRDPVILRNETSHVPVEAGISLAVSQGRCSTFPTHDPTSSTSFAVPS